MKPCNPSIKSRKALNRLLAPELKVEASFRRKLRSRVEGIKLSRRWASLSSVRYGHPRAQIGNEKYFYRWREKVISSCSEPISHCDTQYRQKEHWLPCLHQT